jgi:hypothetical protein
MGYWNRPESTLVYARIFQPRKNRQASSRAELWLCGKKSSTQAAWLLPLGSRRGFVPGNPQKFNES